MKIIITLTTIPTRLSYNGDKGLKSCINSLINQNYPEFEIHFNIPFFNKNTNTEYLIPEWLRSHNDKRLIIFRTEDTGPVTKLLETVKRVTNPEDLIIVVDDDIVYHPEMIEAHVANQKKWKEAVVGYDGLRSRNEDGTMSTVFNDSRDFYFTSTYFGGKVDILQHYKTVSYKRRYFEEDFFDFVKNYYSWSDDLLLAGYFAYKKRDRVVETHPLIPYIETFEDFSRYGGVLVFPVLAHTTHETLEGCNLYRERKIEDNGNNLYTFIDTGYRNN